MVSSTKAAIITGGARGIGAAIARRISAEGHAVAIFDLDAEAGESLSHELLAKGRSAMFIQLDITDRAAVELAVSRVSAELAPPLIVINNAGLTLDNLLFKMTEEEWDRIMSVHLKGAFLVTQAAQSYMVSAEWGRVLSMSSTSSLGNRGQINYATAKAGIQGFTKTVAIELGQFGITANAIAPGFIATDMTAKTAERLGIPFEQFIEESAASIPVRRVGTVDDVASLAAYLVSDEAGFLSGQVIYLAGGPKV